MAVIVAAAASAMKRRRPSRAASLGSLSLATVARQKAREPNESAQVVFGKRARDASQARQVFRLARAHALRRAIGKGKAIGGAEDELGRGKAQRCRDTSQILGRHLLDASLNLANIGRREPGSSGERSQADFLGRAPVACDGAKGFSKQQVGPLRSVVGSILPSAARSSQVLAG